jgi:hypothetical protein
VVDCSPSQGNGFASTVTGGSMNQTTGGYSTVSGGQNNMAAGGSSSVSGGFLVVQSAGYGWSAGSIGSAVSGRFSSP